VAQPYASLQPRNPLTTNSWTLLGFSASEVWSLWSVAWCLMSGGASSSYLSRGAAINTGMNIWPHIHVRPHHSTPLWAISRVKFNTRQWYHCPNGAGFGRAIWSSGECLSEKLIQSRLLHLIARFLFGIFWIFYTRLIWLLGNLLSYSELLLKIEPIAN